MKKIVSIVLALCMLVSVCAMPAMADEAVAISQMQTKDIITIMVDGVYVDCAKYGQMPVIVEGRTLVPLRSVFEALGATVEWDNETRSVASVKGDVTVTLAVDSKEMTVNGTVKTLDVPAQIMNDRTMVPVRAVAEAFGANVNWDNETRTVVIKNMAEPSDTNVASEQEELENMTKTFINLSYHMNYDKLVNLVVDSSVYAEFTEKGINDIKSYLLSVYGSEDTGYSDVIVDAQAEIVASVNEAMADAMTVNVSSVEINGNSAVVKGSIEIASVEGVFGDSNSLVGDVMIKAQEKLGLANVADVELTEQNWIDIAEISYDISADLLKGEQIKTGFEIAFEKRDGKWLVDVSKNKVEQ